MATKVRAVEGLVIDPSEGLDVCIWKLMADRKRRTATEIGVELANVGCNRTEAKDRAVALMRRGWFKRIEHNQVTHYTLKKEISMPTNDTASKHDTLSPVQHAIAIVQRHLDMATEKHIELTKDQKLDLVIAATFGDHNAQQKGLSKNAFDDVLKVAQNTIGVTVVEELYAHCLALQKQQEMDITGMSEHRLYMVRPEFASRMAEMYKALQQPDEPNPPMEEPVPASMVHYPVKGEGVATSIWKVMSDGQPYTAREVAELLEAIGVNQHTTVYRVNQLVKKGWFCVTEKQVKGRKVNAYTLCDNIPMPENEPPYQPNAVDQTKATPQVAQATPVQPREIEPRTGARPGWEPSPPPTEDAHIQVEVDNSERPTFSSMAGAVGSHGAKVEPSYTADVKDVGEINPEEILHPPLLEFSIKIGGQDMTMAEVMAVVAAIRRHGYHIPPAAGMKEAGFIESRMIIKGQEYTEEEMRHLYCELVQNGFTDTTLTGKLMALLTSFSSGGATDK